MFVTVDEESHCPARQTGARFAQDHFGAPLDEKHHIPLLLLVGAQGKIFRLIKEETPEPFVRRGTVRYARWMNVKTFCRLCEHPCGRPLLRPETDPCQRPFIPPGKFAEQPAMPLRVNRTRENLHAWDPDGGDFRRALVDRGKFAGVDADLADLFGK